MSDNHKYIDMLKRTRSEINSWEKTYYEQVGAVFEPGTVIEYSHGEHTIQCVVTRTAYDRLFVIGKGATEYQIYAYRVEMILSFPQEPTDA